MKQAGYSKRSQNRSSDRQRHTQRHSQNNDGKARGNPQQSVEKYLTLARDAASSGDPISAENYYQYADHYYRMVMANRPPRPMVQSKKPQKKESQPVIPETKPEEAPAATQQAQ